MGNRTQNHPEADVLVEDGTISEIGPGLRSRGAEIVDATRSIVMPGFVDAHRHVWKSLFRHTQGDHAAERLAVALKPDDVYAATLVGLLGAIEAGITTVVDWCDLPPDPAFSSAALEAHRDSGIRSVIVQPVSADDSIEDSAAQLAGGSSDLGLTAVEKTLAEWAVIRDKGRRIHAHAGAGDDVPGAVAALAEKGALGKDITLIHCTHLSPVDLAAIASSGARVVLTPASEMTGDLGVPPVQRLMDHKIEFGLGVDNELVASGDVFAQMRAAISIQHAEMFDLKLAGKGSLPNLLTTRHVIRYATIDGAFSAGVADATGSLEPGKRADLIVLRTDRPNIAPVNDPIGAVVWGMDTSNLDWVFVDGMPVLREGDLVGDVGRVRGLALAAQERLLVNAGGPE